MKPTYMVKVTATATAENQMRYGERLVYYIGKGGYAYDDPFIKDGWNCRRWADAYIRNEQEWYEHYEKDYNKPHLWDHFYEVIKIVS